MGDVYRAIDVLLGRPVALKLISEKVSSDRERLARFEREARAASALNHPHIVTVYEVALTGERPHLAMEFVDGTPLRLHLVAGGMPLGRALRIATQIADALAAAHGAGVIHRDLKPDNVMVTTQDSVKLLDFGIAKFSIISMDGATTAVTAPHALVGTPEYMAPEQARGALIDFRADQFAFGVLLWEMLCGKHPFRRQAPLETLAAILMQPPDPVGPDGIPSLVMHVLDRVLAKDPGSRYDDTHEMARDIAQAAVGLSSVTTRVMLSEATRRSRAKGPTGVAVLPLVNVSADPDAEYLCDGLTEAVINDLASFDFLKVMARSTVFRYKDRDVDPRQVARDLGVSAIVTGRVSHYAERLVSHVKREPCEPGRKAGKQHLPPVAPEVLGRLRIAGGEDDFVLLHD